MKFLKTSIPILFCLFLPIAIAHAMLAIRWQPSSDPDIAGYRIHFGFESGRLGQSLDLGNSNLFLIQASVVDTTYYYSVTAYNHQGDESRKSEEVEVFVSSDYMLNLQPQLYPNYPNPFKKNTRILYYIPSTQKMDLKIFNILGNLIFDFKKGIVEPGLHTSFWDGQDMEGQQVASGVYIVAMLYEKWRLSRRIIVTR